MSRHWYDVATLADHMIGEEALKKTDMLIAVANHQKQFFRAGWASCDTARPGTLHLVPEKDLEAALRAAFNEMVEGGMFFETPPSFDAILERLTRPVTPSPAAARRSCLIRPEHHYLPSRLCAAMPPARLKR